MRSSKNFAAFLILSVLCAGIALAADSAPQKVKAPPAQEVAIFSVPNLMEGSTLKSLAQALSKKPGISSAQVDAEKGTFNVTFDPQKSSPDEILKIVSSISKDAKLVAVAPADGKAALGPDCGKCPSARSCSKAKK
jgi:copper chaperone CopZ